MEDTILFFQKSSIKNKKYRAWYFDNSGKLKYTDFGSRSYQHYKDTTGDKLFSHLDHLDEERRRKYISRHSKIMMNFNGKKRPAITVKYTPAWFSMKYLWSYNPLDKNSNPLTN